MKQEKLGSGAEVLMENALQRVLFIWIPLMKASCGYHFHHYKEIGVALWLAVAVSFKSQSLLKHLCGLMGHSFLFADDFDISSVTTSVKGVGEIGAVKVIDLQSPINSLIGRQVVKQSFDLEGDSGSLILLTEKNGEKPRPMGIIWGGTLPGEGASGIGLSSPFTHANFHVDGVNTANVEHQFIPNLLGMSPMHQDNGDYPESNKAFRDAPEEVSVSLQLGEREPKRQCSDSTFTLEDQK
ncbi:hypothetical protein MRB53_021002 [Persea americana]|uniref:Uncharacterized protein n=1 Tax=Persea americana TaxID=3435 RepID=A0ACC2L363_PERAE|nr:hypothetical protein MRB53_021002 [Persea americana]